MLIGEAGQEDRDDSGVTSGLASISARPEPRAEILDIKTRVTEEASSWWRYAWRLTVRNAADEAVEFDAHIEWHDKDGFIIDTATDRSLILDGAEEKTFTGDTLISMPSAGNVTDVVAIVLQR